MIELGVMVFVKEGIIDQREKSSEHAQKPTKGIIAFPILD